MRSKVLQFLYQQVQDNKIPQIKKGMVEELEAFVESLLAEREATKIATRMTEQAKENTDDVR